MSIKNNKIVHTVMSFILLLTLLALAPFFTNDFILFVISLLLINMLWASATWAIFHQGGQALFAVVIIAGVGGYTTGLLGGIIHNTWITIIIAMAVSCILGMLFYLLATRVIGHIQFAILNLAFIFMFKYIIVAFPNFTYGIDGLKVRYFSPQSLFANIGERYWAILSITAVAIFFIYKIMNSRFGRILTLIGRNLELADTVGVDTKKYIMLAYLIFPPFIGLGGVLYTHFIGFISPELWNAELSLIMVFCTLIGGTNNILGPIVGAVIATGIPILFDITAEFRFGIVGILVILIFIFKPEGVVSWLQEIIHVFFKTKNVEIQKTGSEFRGS